jgi:hypothetical protein
MMEPYYHRSTVSVSLRRFAVSRTATVTVQSLASALKQLVGFFLHVIIRTEKPRIVAVDYFFTGDNDKLIHGFGHGILKGEVSLYH